MLQLQKHKCIILHIVTRLKALKEAHTNSCSHAYSKHTKREQEKGSRSVSMAATELLVFLLHWVGCLPACLFTSLSLSLSVCLSMGTGMVHRAGNWDSLQRLATAPDETPHSSEANRTRTPCSVTSYSSSTLMVSHITPPGAFLLRHCPSCGIN